MSRHSAGDRSRRSAFAVPPSASLDPLRGDATLSPGEVPGLRVPSHAAKAGRDAARDLVERRRRRLLLAAYLASIPDACPSAAARAGAT